MNPLSLVEMEAWTFDWWYILRSRLTFTFKLVTKIM